MFPSVLEIFSIGIGPSSSHTVGPMRAAFRFIELLRQKKVFADIDRVVCELYGSLALTGKGHRTDMAIIFGLMSTLPESIDPDAVDKTLNHISEHRELLLGGERKISFDPEKDILFKTDKTLPLHPNALRLTAYSHNQEKLSKVYYSIGGGFIQDHDEIQANVQPKQIPLPALFTTAKELLAHCEAQNLSVADVVRKNELALHSKEALAAGIKKIWQTMRASIFRGLENRGILPGGLNITRRAPLLHDQLTDPSRKKGLLDPMEWVAMWAIAVNEENAASGRVVTAPTNGSSGVIPACLLYMETYFPELFSDEFVENFLLTASAMGVLFKAGASISAAEMGCMGEVGVASAMAAAALTAVQGGTPAQVCQAAKMGIVHHLGLTCDPVKGLVQIPCIERNAIGAVTAINCSLLALKESHKQPVTLDEAIKTMKETGKGMHTVFKETSLGGLAVNVVEC